MNGPSPQIPPNRKTPRLAIVVLIFLGLIASCVVYRHSLAVSIQTRIDAIHQAGFPATCAELDKWYPQPPVGENAADVFKEAFAHYRTWTNKDTHFVVPADVRDTNRFSSIPRSKRDLLPIVGYAKLPPRTEPLTPEMQKLVAEYVSDNAESLRLLHEAGSMKSCRYPIDLTKGASTLLPHLSPLRKAAWLLDLEAIQHTEEQQPQLAVESVVVSLGFARSLNQEPTILSYIVHGACQNITLGSLERILNRMPLTGVQLATLATAIQEPDDQEAFTRAFVGERCTGVDAFEDLSTGRRSLKDVTGSSGNDPAETRFQIAIYRTAGLLQQDEKSYLDIMEECVKATRLLPREGISVFPVMDDKLEHLSKRRFVSRMLLTALDRIAIKAAQCDSKIRDAQAALAVERYRLANDRLPNQLGDLVPTFLPSVPNDPFDGKPLRYKTLPKGYIVYSVGDDREGNGGAEKDSKGVSYVPGTDITFTVER